MDDFITTCESAARAGGKVLLEYRDRFTVQEKAPADLVTEADLASQEVIVDVLRRHFPNHSFLGEEGAPNSQSIKGFSRNSEDSAYQWVIDPLDGTTNYVHRLEHYCVSVALRRRNEVIVGCVFDPNRDECFTGVREGGAYLNGVAIQTSPVKDLNNALVCASFPAKVPRGASEVHRFMEVLYEAQAVRRLGSAALNLCYVAAGRIDAYWATSVNIWDVAAGILMVNEAGGAVSDLDGRDLVISDPKLVVAATRDLHSGLLACLANAKTG